MEQFAVTQAPTEFCNFVLLHRHVMSVSAQGGSGPIRSLMKHCNCQCVLD